MGVQHAGPGLVDAEASAPPRSEEAEECVLGAMLQEEEARRVGLERLEPADFHHQGRRRIFAAFARLNGRGQDGDVVALADELRAAGELDAAGGMEALARLVDAVPSTANLETHADRLRELRMMRELQAFGREASQVSAGPGQGTEIVGRALERIRQIAEHADAEDGDQEWDMAHVLAEPSRLRLPEALIPGIAYSRHMTLYCGEPKVGAKTSFLTYGASAVAQGGRFLGQPVFAGKVLWIMGEGSKEHIGRYLAQVDACIPEGRFIVRRSGPDPVSELERHVRAHDPDLVVIDSLGTWLAPLDADLNTEEVVPPLRRLERLARSGPAIVVIHHGRKEDGDPAGSHKIKAIPDLIRVVEQGETDNERVIRGTGRWHVPTIRFRMEVVGEHPKVSDLKLVRFRRVDPDREIDEQIIDFLRANPDASKRTIRSAVDGSHAAIDDALQRLVRNGIVDRDTSGRAHTHRIRQNP